MAGLVADQASTITESISIIYAEDGDEEQSEVTHSPQDRPRNRSEQQEQQQQQSLRQAQGPVAQSEDGEQC